MTTISPEEVEKTKKDAYKICQEFLGDIWSELPFSEFRFSSISGGLSNTLYLCALPENSIVKKPKTPRQVLLRIYGIMQEDVNAIVTEVATFTLLAEKKLGPKLYGIFPNGRLEEFIPSRPLLIQDFRKMSSAIAREMAKIHSLDVPLKKIPDFWIALYKKWLNDVETDSKEKKNSSFEYLDLFTENMKWLNEEMKKSNSPIVFCHNDLHGGNILLHEDSPSAEDPKLTLIDFEVGSYHYRGFDIGSHFAEWAFQYSTSEYPFFEYNIENYPSEEERISFISVYLDQLAKEGVIPPTSIENEIKVIMQEIDIFVMAAHLLWSLWSWKMTFHTGTGMDHVKHAKDRMDAFGVIKQKYPNRVYIGDSAIHQ